MPSARLEISSLIVWSLALRQNLSISCFVLLPDIPNSMKSSASSSLILSESGAPQVAIALFQSLNSSASSRSMAASHRYYPP